MIEKKNKVIHFAKTEEDYSAKGVRESFMQRMLHLNSLDDQVKKSLKYAEKKKPVKDEKNSVENFLEDLDLDLDDSMFSEDF